MMRGILLTLLFSALPMTSLAADWITPAEAAHFKTTPSYADTHAPADTVHRSVLPLPHRTKFI